MKVRHGVGTFVADGPAEFGKSSLDCWARCTDSSLGRCSRCATCLKPVCGPGAERGNDGHFTVLAEEVPRCTPPSTIRRIPDPRCALSSHHRTGFGNPIFGADGDGFNSALRSGARRGARQDRKISVEAHREIYRHPYGNVIEARSAMERHLRSPKTSRRLSSRCAGEKETPA